MLEPKRKLGLIGGLIIQTQPAFLSTIRADIRCTGFPLVCEKGRLRRVSPAGKRSDLTSAIPKALVEGLNDPLVVDAVEVGTGR